MLFLIDLVIDLVIIHCYLLHIDQMMFENLNVCIILVFVTSQIEPLIQLFQIILNIIANDVHV